MAGADQVEAIIERLRERGGRATSTRRATIEVLLDHGRSHLAADDIVALVKVGRPDVAESTVYRTLNALEELGIVDHVHLGHGPSTYHLRANEHQHLRCDTCGAVVEVPDGLFGTLAEQLQRRYGFRINPRHFAMSGECRRCQGRAGPGSATAEPGSG